MKVYVTFCSERKEETLKDTGRAVPPDVLYPSPRIQRFMKECKAKQLRWAIFSDQYGVWCPEESHEYYNKSPDSLTDEEYSCLLNDFDTKLGGFEEIYFYFGTGRVHSLYRRILRETKLRANLRFIKYFWDIV